MVEDETRVEFEAREDHIWAPKGVYPQVEITQEKKAHCFFGALDVFTGEPIVHESERMVSRETVRLLEKIRSQYQRRMKKKKPVLLIWDGAPWHRGEVRKYLKGKNWLELMSFPPYSPELNPQEWIWKEAKKAITNNHEEEDFADLVYKFYRFITQRKFSTKMCKNILRF